MDMETFPSQPYNTTNAITIPVPYPCKPLGEPQHLRQTTLPHTVRAPRRPCPSTPKPCPAQRRPRYSYISPSLPHGSPTPWYSATPPTLRYAPRSTPPPATPPSLSYPRTKNCRYCVSNRRRWLCPRRKGPVPSTINLSARNPPNKLQQSSARVEEAARCKAQR